MTIFAGVLGVELVPTDQSKPVPIGQPVHNCSASAHMQVAVPDIAGRQLKFAQFPTDSRRKSHGDKRRVVQIGDPTNA